MSAGDRRTLDAIVHFDSCQITHRIDITASVHARPCFLKSIRCGYTTRSQPSLKTSRKLLSQNHWVYSSSYECPLGCAILVRHYRGLSINSHFYIDDLLIAPSKVGEHNQYLTLLFQCLSATFSLAVGVLDYATEEILQQLVPVIWEPVGFFSQHLSSTETTYSAFGRELLAAYGAIKHFRQAVKGHLVHRPQTIKVRIAY